MIGPIIDKIIELPMIPAYFFLSRLKPPFHKHTLLFRACSPTSSWLMLGSRKDLDAVGQKAIRLNRYWKVTLLHFLNSQRWCIINIDGFEIFLQVCFVYNFYGFVGRLASVQCNVSKLVMIDLWATQLNFKMFINSKILPVKLKVSRHSVDE